MSKLGARGFSLVEVLVALLIISVAMLGITGLFTHSIQSGRTATLQFQALLLAGDVAERIRANPRAGSVYQNVRGNEGCVSEYVHCDESSMAAHDIALWQHQAARTLPGGRIRVAFDNSSSPHTYTISVTWSEPGARVPPGLAMTIPVRPD